MPKVSPLLVLTTLVFTASTSAFGTPLNASTAADNSFSLFFEPGGTTLSTEGRQIISVAAERFAATQSHHAAAHIFVNSDSNDQDSASVSMERVKAVGNELARDGIQRKFFTMNGQAGVHTGPLRLLGWVDQRVSISIEEKPVPGRIVG